jgi:hypothetical protein
MLVEAEVQVECGPAVRCYVAKFDKIALRVMFQVAQAGRFLLVFVFVTLVFSGKASV